MPAATTAKLRFALNHMAAPQLPLPAFFALARSLGLAVIAEGVETEQQLGLLAREGCQYYQGFLCSQPLTTAALAALMQKWATARET